MAYSELIKNFERVRDYMREFYVYGFRSREEYRMKSPRAYDNERRRIESWLGDYMSFRRDASGKNVFLSVDSRAIPHNPLYKAFKAKSFTRNDLILHFYLLDLLSPDLASHRQALTVREIAERIETDYLSHFDTPYELDESTVRKKLREYEALGLLKSERRGRELTYSRWESTVDLSGWRDAVLFFSEADPLGVIGSYLLDKYDAAPDYFGFKHRYILHALDSQILCALLEIMGEKRRAELQVRSPRRGDLRQHTVFPAKIYVSAQTGRQYLLSYAYRQLKPILFRIDNIKAVKPGSVEKQPEKYGGYCEKFGGYLWGVSTGAEYLIDHIEMTVHVNEGEGYIVSRLEREKRGGRVEKIDDHTYRLTADVYDAIEMLPWIRTFIGRIAELKCDDSYVTDTFFADLTAMRQMYGGDADAVQ
ncbi:MAG: WYL domain-containing protein [Peptococcaceae bacterium]|jgi:DNA-binding transcriptional ArsR family regulator|nr:WYL domain-containing protein [Peptococcaceae bacterium]